MNDKEKQLMKDFEEVIGAVKDECTQRTAEQCNRDECPFKDEDGFCSFEQIIGTAPYDWG